MTSAAPVSTGQTEGPSAANPGARAVSSRSHPARMLVVQVALAYVVLSVVCVGVGLLLTHTAALAGVRHWDVSVNRWFVRRRTGTLDSLTAVGSHLAETLTVVGVGLLVVGLLWWRRRDLRTLSILVVGLVLEVSVFVTTTLFVDRSRPPVHHLDAAPPTSSFPSGHAAAAVALYVGLVVVVHRVWRRRGITIAATVLAVCIVVAVGLSRLYRGMHHPSDVVVGAALGAAALTIATGAAPGCMPEPNCSTQGEMKSQTASTRMAQSSRRLLRRSLTRPLS